MLGVALVGVVGDTGLGREGSLGMLIGVILTVRRDTGERGELRVDVSWARICAAGDAGAEVGEKVRYGAWGTKTETVDGRR
jgi:hypothetical protein